MAQYAIYGDGGSGNCLKARWIADYLDLSYRWIETSVVAGATRTEQFLALNPAGLVPLLVTPDGKRLAQSNAIIFYLAEIHDSPLVPADPFERAKSNEWLFWEQYSHEPYIAVRRFQKVYLNKSDAELDPKLLQRGLAALDRMQMQLAKTPFIVGSRFTVADIALVAYTRVAHEGGFDLAAHPDVRRWIARVERELNIV